MAGEQFMAMALAEAAKGLGRTAPNPPVGAVIVKGGRVIATGYHRKAGGPHAEVEALAKAGRHAKGATLYVTLEPCAHQGRTPPCTEAITSARIAQVVVGVRDPNRLVDGRGVRALRKRKIRVRVGCLSSPCEAFYRPYRIFVGRHRPFVILKGAVSLDGMVATLGGESQWLTSAASRRHGRGLRGEVDAVLVGVGTVQRDNPRLTTRIQGGKGHDPIRVLVDSRLRAHPEAQIFRVRSRAPTWVMTTDEAPRLRQKDLELAGAKVFRCPQDALGQVDLAAMLRLLADCGVMSLLVEGGPTLASHLVASHLADRLILYIAMKLLGKGLPFLAELSVPSLSGAIGLASPRIAWIGSELCLTAELQ